MQHLPRRLAAAFAALALSALAAPAALAATDHSGTLSSLSQLGATTQLAGSLPQLGHVVALGDARATVPATALVNLQHRDQSGLLKFVSAVSNPKSSQYEHYLTPAQFNAAYAASSATVGQVENYLRGFGLSVISVPANHAYVQVRGDVAEMDRAFGTQIAYYQRGSAIYTAPIRSLSIPRALSGAITNVVGLNTGALESLDAASNPLATPPYPAYVIAPPYSSSYGSSLSTAPGYGSQSQLPDVIQGYDPAQLEGAYGITPAIAGGLNGSGQTVAVIDPLESPTLVQDLDQWSAANGLPAPNLTIDGGGAEFEDQPDGPEVPTELPILGGLNVQDPSDDFGEETMDLEAIHLMAPQAKLVLQVAAGLEEPELEIAQNAIVTNKEGQIVSNSYGTTGGGADDTNSDDSIFEQGGAEGIGFYFSSGDEGDNTTGNTDGGNRGVSTPANSPYVTAVGGTALAVGAQNNYEWEKYWGTDTATLTNGAWPKPTWDYGAGGGVSESYAEPTWQQGIVPTNFADYWSAHQSVSGAPEVCSSPETAEQTLDGCAVPSGRVVPDVSMDADPQTGLGVGLSQDFSVYNDPDDTPLPTDKDAYGVTRIGGTSLSSPLFAGMMALADQAAGKPHGFSDPALYALSSAAPGDYHDVTAVPAQTTLGVVRTNYTDNIDSSGGTSTVLRTIGDTETLTAQAGYDDATGLGSPNGLSFLCGLAPGSTLAAGIAGSPCAPKAATPTAPATPTTTKPVAKPVVATCKVPTTLSFAQGPPRGVREIKAVVSINGKVAHTIRARKITRVAFARPRATRFTLKIVTTWSNGEVLSYPFTYDGCKRSARVRHILVKPKKATRKGTKKK